MCGIAGIIGRVDEDNRAALQRMADALVHRGPDKAGYWVSPGGREGHGCLLAHRRLSILDLSTAADQPMIDPRSGQVLTYNGEIYNYEELRRQLIADGEEFQSSGDTAVMLRALALKGYGAVTKLRGMFAFALWDEKTCRLALARDPLGIKPLYVCRNPDPSLSRSWSLLFASEVRAILASGLIGTPRLNPAAVASVVWNGFVAGPVTAVRGVESLWPGEVKVFDHLGAQVAAERYWNMPRGDWPRRMTEAELAEALRECVRLHLASDVPLGVFLSSGVDSSAVANLARQSSKTPVNTFTLVFEEQSLSEGNDARRIAAAIGTTHHEILLTEAQFVAALETALEGLDQPTFDGLNSYYISRAVREAGLKVALVGTGGDELFGGYTSFHYLPTLQRWARRTGWLPTASKVAAAKLVTAVLHPTRGAVGPQTRWAKLPDMVRAGIDTLALYQLGYSLFLPDFQSELLNGVARQADVADGLPQPLRQQLAQEIEGHSSLSAISVLEQRCFLGERLLRDTDAASMAVSLETRLPLVDSVLLEKVYCLQEDARYYPLGRKQMLRKIGLCGLDPALFDRPKTGFVLPYDRWIRQGLSRAMDETMRDGKLAQAVGLSGLAVERLWSAFQTSSPGMYWSRVWALYVLIRWCHKQGVLL
jgi:asparagine synthase (glutamine-hydrolysing)